MVEEMKKEIGLRNDEMMGMLPAIKSVLGVIDLLRGKVEEHVSDIQEENQEERSWRSTSGGRTSRWRGFSRRASIYQESPLKSNKCTCDAVLQKARERSGVKWKDGKMSFFEDMSREMEEEKKALLPFKKAWTISQRRPETGLPREAWYLQRREGPLQCQGREARTSSNNCYRV